MVTVEEVFVDFKGRRAGIIKALTIDFRKFYQECDPEKKNLCLYGFANEGWKVDLPIEEVPTELPEPAIGINFCRDHSMQVKEWLYYVARHSDAWLIAVAFYYAGACQFVNADRERLFEMINDFPTILEVVTHTAKIQQKEKSAAPNQSSSKSKSNSKLPQVSKSRGTYSKPQIMEVSDEHDDNVCGACGVRYVSDEFL